MSYDSAARMNAKIHVSSWGRLAIGSLLTYMIKTRRLWTVNNGHHMTMDSQQWTLKINMQSVKVTPRTWFIKHAYFRSFYINIGEHWTIGNFHRKKSKACSSTSIQNIVCCCLSSYWRIANQRIISQKQRSLLFVLTNCIPHDEVHSIHRYVIKFVSGFLKVLRFPPPI
jgi:hypothetical protein